METKDEHAELKESFKKPQLLIGKIGKLPKKVTKPKEPEEELIEISPPEPNETPPTPPEDNEKSATSSPQQPRDKSTPYTEPEWSAAPDCDAHYGFDILKQGSIIGTMKLEKKAFWTFGRLPQCDISMAHPTISRYHAVLQYRPEDSGSCKKGYYLYDLDSTHGTFLNKLRLKPHHYVRVQVGHMIKLGCSTRNYILTGPADDEEEESEFSMTELKQQRQNELERRREAAAAAEAERIAKEKRDEERGVDWGMGDDADEESDLTENPYAQTNNEELYLDDPKKALRGFMEREGLSFEYDCSEHGIGQFLCKVSLPVDDERGRPIVAEVLHKGKKKEAVAQCALEACRILDRFGVLRQATHESKKRKAKNWEDNDYYDSDDDTYLDRTGSIERKRANRMKAKQPQTETYKSLLEKETKLAADIAHIEQQLEASRLAKPKSSDDDGDTLDSFMEQLKQPVLDAQKLTQLRIELSKLKREHAGVIKLVNIARPADLPPLVPQYATQPACPTNRGKLPMFGKRLMVKVQKPPVHAAVKETEDKETENEEEKVSPVIDDVDRLNEIKVAEKGIEIEEESKPLENDANAEQIRMAEEKKEAEEAEKRRRKNQRRMQQRQEKQEAEKQRGYEADFKKEDYDMWVPPSNQSGDGRTSLNDKFGY